VVRLVSCRRSRVVGLKQPWTKGGSSFLRTGNHFKQNEENEEEASTFDTGLFYEGFTRGKKTSEKQFKKIEA